ncbi:AAA domain-containing protein [Delftia sp. WSY_7]|uniref:AAA domain-containing protein n=1 Tax=Delftia sp. WSY_7 TaxID=3367202 RepID=UPI00370A4FB9
MDIEIWDGGLQQQEVEAIRRIQRAFSEGPSSVALPPASGAMRSRPPGEQRRESMFPWKGYAGFRFVDAKGREGEFDLVIVTHCNILIVELKDWNYGRITASGDVWFKGEKSMGRSPVTITRNKKFLLERKIERLTTRFTNKGFAPHIHFFVVMTGDSDFSQLPEVDLQHTLHLTDFLKFSNNVRFDQYFRPHPESKVLRHDVPIFDQLFLGGKTTAKAIRVSGYTATEEIFRHPNDVYTEYLAQSEISKGTEALLRIWDFRKIPGNKGATAEGRADIVSREREVLGFISHQNLDLYHHCLRSLTSFERSEVTTQYGEVYELPPGHLRFNEFLGKYAPGLTQSDRLNLTKLLLAKFADLHEMKIAHRDIADHSLWISPAKEIALSNFISAYHQPIGTVGDYRAGLSVGAVQVQALLDNSPKTPFQQDVHALGLVAWHLLTAQRISPKSLRNITSDLMSSDAWYANVLLEAVTSEFSDASAFFEALMGAQPAVDNIPMFDASELEAYQRPINHSRQFPESDDFLVTNDDKEVYVSGDKLVKAWLNVGAKNDDTAQAFRVLTFLKRLARMAVTAPPCLPRIHDFGLATRSSSMYLVTDRITGTTWADTSIQEAEKLGVIEKLIKAVGHLHELGISHGDLHPGNVMLDAHSNTVYLVDIPDFIQHGTEAKNHLYSPETIDTCSSEQRDIFAVLRMSCELLDIQWGGVSENYPKIADAVYAELHDFEFGFKDFGRFRKALSTTQQLQEDKSIEVTLTSALEKIRILPDNGHLFVAMEPSNKEESTLRVTFTGIGGSLRTFYSKTQRCFIGALAPQSRSDIPSRAVEDSQFEISAAITVKPGRIDQLAELSEHLLENDAFSRAIQRLHPAAPALDDAAVSQQLRNAFQQVTAPVSETAEAAIDIPTDELWRAILDTETESSPNIELTGIAMRPMEADAEVILPYEADIDPLGTFTSTDEVEAIVVKDGEEKLIGEVFLKRSALNEVWLKRARSAAFGLKDGDVVFFRSKQDRASHRKRKVALERLLDRGGVLPDLVDLFDPSCQKQPTTYDITVTEEDFARYDREDNHGNKISLNPQQREAFAKLLSSGPLSLLQGPPGTGKTEFIAAFVHFLVEKLDVRRILLVSQSHEAVNTAAERIRRHCMRLGTPLDVVRFSNREGAVSSGLKDVYSHSLTAEKRELFQAEYRHRVTALSDALGLHGDFLSSIVEAELRLFKQIDHLESLLSGFADLSDEEDIKALKPIIAELDERIREKLRDTHGITLSRESEISEAKAMLTSRISAEYGVRPNEMKKVRALARIARDVQDALSAERVNCDEFYARSRRLVTGTCVGIGQGHIGIHSNIYDFVIIDEAARSISSELAIAMQSAKRVLLVGDHLQLPPLYSNAHKAALARRLGIHDGRNDLDEVLRSDFARVFNSEYGRQTSATLLTQYRMAPAIGNLVSHTFYKGLLKNGARTVPNIYQSAPAALQAVVTWLDTSKLGGFANHLTDRGVSIYNRCEAEQVIAVLRQIADSGQFFVDLSAQKEGDDAPIGVICMYAEQKRLIRQKFNQEIWNDGFKSMVKIDTVDSYQGKENRIIILSLTRSDPERSAGFLRAPNRINVAISRAMDRLLIVGNTAMWNTQNRDKPLGRIISHMNGSGESEDYRFIPATRTR